MGLQELKDVILGFLGSGVALWFAYEMRQLTKSVEGLNIKLATILEKTSNHEERIKEHSERLHTLERTKRK